MITTIPVEFLGGGVVVMFGMVAAAGISMLADVTWNRRNMVILAVSLSIGLGLQLEPDTARMLLASGLVPAAFIAITLNLVLLGKLAAEEIEKTSGGMASHKDD